MPMTINPTISPAQQKINRSFAGMRGKRAGDAFERMLEVTHRMYLARGVADIYKLPVPTAPAPRHVRGAHGGLRVLSERQRCDYTGHLIGSGRAVYMEAKSCHEPMGRLPIIGNSRSGFGIKQHQLEALAAADDHGAIGAIVWQNGEDVIAASVSLFLKSKIREGGLKSIDRGWFVPVALSAYFIDWLKPLGVSK